jgi:hypothetical protein
MWDAQVSLTELYGIHIHTLIVKIQEHTKKCSMLQQNVFTIEHYNSSMFRPLVGHPKGLSIHICVKCSL